LLVVRPSTPNFQSVVDLGLRDVGVKSEPRRLAAHFGKALVPLLILFVLSVGALCVIVRETAVGAWVAVPFVLGWAAVVAALAVRTAKRSPQVVVKVSAEGTNQSTWLLIVPFLLVALSALLQGDPLLIPVVVLMAIMVLLVWRARGRVPDVLRELRFLLAAHESVLGDGVGVVPGVQNGREALRLVVATDRRLLVTASTRSKGPFLLVDVPYRDVSRFGIEWKYWGRVGELSLTAPGADGAPSETHIISSIAPANLVSIAQALSSNGVPPDDPAAVSEAQAAWERAREEARRRAESREPLLDREAMSTQDFDRGLWLLLALSVFVFWIDPLGLAELSDPLVPGLAIAIALGVICGYVSGTRSSLAYVVPFSLLVVPTFFYTEAEGVILLMIALSMFAAIGLLAGARLRRLRTERASVDAERAASPKPRPARGSLRYAISGIGLSRISGILLAAVVALVTAAAIFGLDPSMLRLAVEEATAKQLSVDGRSNLNGNAASLTYTPGPDLKELIKDEHWGAGPNDGARWELRSSFTKGYNVVSLAHYIFVEPRLDDPAAVADFVADKDREHSRVARHSVTHTERVVDGRKGYVWKHRARDRSWQYSAWFPQPVNSVRLECVAKKQEDRFRRLCAEAIGSLEFH
jgi:hypothetical protein